MRLTCSMEQRIAELSRIRRGDYDYDLTADEVTELEALLELANA
jgi:hypothetical protein